MKLMKPKESRWKERLKDKDSNMDSMDSLRILKEDKGFRENTGSKTKSEEWIAPSCCAVLSFQKFQVSFFADASLQFPPLAIFIKQSGRPL